MYLSFAQKKNHIIKLYYQKTQEMRNIQDLYDLKSH